MLIPFLQVLFYGENAGQLSDITKVPFLPGLYEAWVQLLKKEGRFVALLTLCVSVVLVFLLKNGFRYLALYVLVPVRTGIMMRLRQNIYAHLLRMGYPFFQKNRRADVMTRFGQDVQEVEYGIVNFMEIGLKEPIAIAITLVSLIWLSPMMTLWVLLLLPLSALLVGRIGKLLKKESVLLQEQVSLLQSMVDELMHGIRIIISLGARNQLMTSFSAANNQYRQQHTAMLRRKELASPLSELLGITVVAVLLLVGGNMVLRGTGGLSPEIFITYIVVFSQIISPAKAFSNAWYFIQKGAASLQRIDELLQMPAEGDAKRKWVMKPSFDQAINILGLSFAFDDKTALVDITLQIKKGEKVAIVGPSGSGKTTLVNILCGFYRDSHNSVVIDETLLNDIHPDDWHRLYAIVTQEPLLFYGTVRENLLMAKPDATDTDIFQALVMADAKFIHELPLGLETPIGERGVKLSGGQQQKLALARAFLKNAPILILDEATAAMDSLSDQSVREAISRLSQGKTVIAVAHRLSSIQLFDRIVVLEHGQVTGSGTHDELLQWHAVYQQLVAGQQLNG